MKEKLESSEILFLPIPEEQDNEIIQSEDFEDVGDTYEHTSLNLDGNSLKDIVSDLYKSFSDQLDSISNSIQSPSEVSIEFSLAFSKKLNIWIANFEGEGSVKVGLKWELGKK